MPSATYGELPPAILILMPKLPASIGKYKITDKLGRGGMSVLYIGKHPTLGTPVVVKKLTLKGDPAHRERFKREASLMMELRHENVVGVFDHFREGSGHYLVMEYVDGHSLAELLAREGVLSPEEANWLIGKISAALAHIHSHGVVHRDIKPSNVLISNEGTVKLADFGIAFTPGGGEDITSEGTALGTPSFMSPEQLEDARSADKRSDIWSLGVCFFELITGRKFVTGPTPAAIREALPEALRSMPLRLPPQLPRVSKKLLRKSLRMRPEGRMPDGAAVLRLMGSVARVKNPPSRLAERLEGLVSSLTPGQSSEATPENPRITEGQNPDCPETSEKVAAIRSLFSIGGNSAPDRAARKQGTTAVKKPRKIQFSSVSAAGKRSIRFRLALSGLSLLLAFLIFSIFVSPARIFSRSSHGILRLSILFTESAPEYWVEGAVVRLFREEKDGLHEVSRPSLRSNGNDRQLSSRRISLPTGAYRVSWSLGDTVSWTNFRLPAVAENGTDDGVTLTILETLGDPPVFPLDLEWSVSDAESDGDLSSAATMSWERLDSGGKLESGGRYQFIFKAPGYRPAEIQIAISPWRRYLRLKVSLWQQPGFLILVNESGRAAMPRLNDSGRYLDVGESPVSTRIGRLPDGDSFSLAVSPGRYSVAPGFNRDSSTVIILSSGQSRTLRIISDDEGHLLIQPE